MNTSCRGHQHIVDLRGLPLATLYRDQSPTHIGNLFGNWQDASRVRSQYIGLKPRLKVPSFYAWREKLKTCARFLYRDHA